MEYSFNIAFDMENFIGTMSVAREAIKIKTYECYTKFQEVYPSHRSNLVNKQLGYDSIIEHTEDADPIKIKNCITSARPNSELFKRFSKTLIANIKNDVDQLLFFTSADALSRLETSIGLPTNPGLFLIVGLTYLDQKYKQSYQKCDIEFSFLEFRESQMFDLICFTGEPITPQRDCSGNDFANFKEHWVRATTFNQFIKIFKVALFNNRERDFKNNNNGKCKSTFIMKVRNKLYSQQGELLRSQETTLIDFEVNSIKETSSNQKEKQGSKSLLDYVLIDMRNANPSQKQVHYHMVEENYLLLLLRKFLTKSKQGSIRLPSSSREDRDLAYVGGQIVIINCMPANKDTFSQGHSYLTNITGMIGEAWQAKVVPKPKQIKKYNHRYVECQLSTIVKGLVLSTYSSLRNFTQYKQKLISEVKRCRMMIRELRRAINCSMKEKLQLVYMKNQLVAYEIKLIGSCIKSDHFKDFYNAKSYIQLEREVCIKTMSVKEEIKGKLRIIEEVQKKFFILKRKETDVCQKYNKQKQNNKPSSCVESLFQNTTNWASHLSSPLQKKDSFRGDTTTSKFKKLSNFKGGAEVNQFGQLKKLISYLNEYMYSLWDSYIIFDERTVANSIEFEETMLSEEALLSQTIARFVGEVEGISQTDIVYEQDANLYNNNQVGLFRSLNFLGLIGPKKKLNNYQIGKRLVIKQKEQKRGTKKYKTQVHSLQKLPSITQKARPVIISGDIKISEMLIDPSVVNPSPTSSFHISE